MIKSNLPFHLEDKIFEMRFESNETVSKVVSYFPLSELERKEFCTILNMSFFDEFYSIFTDVISEEEWNKTKEQIKKKFKDELFDVDKMS